MFHLGLVTGVRRGELLGLRWADVDLEHGAIEVLQRWERLGHADIGITLNTYTHTVSDQHRDDLIDGVFE